MGFAIALCAPHRGPFAGPSRAGGGCALCVWAKAGRKDPWAGCQGRGANIGRADGGGTWGGGGSLPGGSPSPHRLRRRRRLTCRPGRFPWARRGLRACAPSYSQRSREPQAVARAASCNFRRGVTLDSDRRLGATLDSGRRSGATLPCPALFVITLQGGQGVSRPRLSRVTLDCDHPSVSPPYTRHRR